MSDDPVDPVAAVVHPDPYPYYARLVARGGIARDDALGMWAATSAADVEAVLAERSLSVRPPDERIPPSIAGTAAGAIFGRFARMSDGPEHAARRDDAERMLGRFDDARVASASREHAEGLAPELPVEEFLLQLPLQVVGALLGIPAALLPGATAQTRAFVGSFAAAPGSGAAKRGANSAAGLLELMCPLTDSGPGVVDDSVANGIGLLVQSGEATAALMANTLLALATRDELRAAARSDSALLGDVVREVARFDAPVQNTRRWALTPVTIAGHDIAAGDAILVVLAAANRDPAANPDPDRFDPARAERKSFVFGAGAHACPGETLSIAIATAGVGELLRLRREPTLPRTGVSYHPSVNIRRARFA